MSNFDIQHWYKGAVAASVALLGIGGAARSKEILAFGLGLLLLGLGEWINHQLETYYVPPGGGMGPSLASGEVRRPRLFGLLLDGVGILLFLAGLSRFVVSLFQK